MPFNGSGVYNPIGSPDFPAVAATTIRAAQYNNEINDIASALTNCVTRDGQSSATADLPMGGNKHTNVAAAALRTQYARAAEVQDGTLTALNTIAGVDTITAAAPLSLAAYTTGQTFSFVSAGVNTGPVTLNINALGAKAVTKLGATALAAGDIPSGAVVEVFYDGTRFQLVNLAANSALAASGGPGGTQFGFRNKIINGDCQVAQRGAVAAVNGSLTYGGCDRIGVAPVSFTTCSGTIQQQQSGFGARGFSQAVTGVTTTGSGTMQFVERLEAKDVKDLNGKTVTVQAKFFQNTGAVLNCGFVISKAGSLDNFSSPAVIATGATQSVPSGTLTAVTTTFTLGATDCDNGLQIIAAFNGVGAVAAKDFHITELQFEAGPSATQFEYRPIEVELALCQRYYETGVYRFRCVDNGNTSVTTCNYAVSKRAAATLTGSPGQPGTSANNLDNFTIQLTAVGTTDTGNVTWTASAEL